MSSELLQLINDEIICYKKAISDVEEKLRLLNFLNSVDDFYIGKLLNLDKNELTAQKTELQENLRELIDKKLKLTGEEEPPKELEINSKNKNSFVISKYLSAQHFDIIDDEFDKKSFNSR